MSGSNNYSDNQFAAKERFVTEVLKDFAPRSVLDVGCNVGHFSEISARAGARVVAIDLDSTVVGSVWRRACAQQLDILPLVINLTRPSPALGWLNQECRSFLDRAQGHFDLVLMLALLHHLVVTERVPIDEVLSLAATLTRDLAVIEFVGPEDSMFQRLTRGRGHLHRNLTRNVFEDAAVKYFDILRSQPNETQTRSLYLLRRKRG